MNDPTMEEARLLELAALPADDPRRREAGKDPRVRAWLLEHDAFVRDDAHLPAGEADAVARAAGAALARARAESSARRAEVLELPRPARTRGGLPRWALAAAAVAIVAGAGVVVVPRLAPRPEARFRSATPDVHAPRVATQPAAHDGEGRIVLRWESVAGAEAYRVEIFSGLTVAATHDAGAGDSLVLDATALPAGDVLLWRVTALKAGAAIANSPPRELPR